MTLDPSYLAYPMRRHGMDHDSYAYSALPTRAPLRWHGGRLLQIWPVISLEYFPMIPSDMPFRAPGHMQTAYPDYRHYTAREYGTRIGIYRLLDAFAAVGARVSVACNSMIAQRYPALIEDIIAGGHEIIAHERDHCQRDGTRCRGSHHRRNHRNVAPANWTAPTGLVVNCPFAKLRHAEASGTGRH